MEYLQTVGAFHLPYAPVPRLPGTASDSTDPGPQTRVEEVAGSCPWWRSAWHAESRRLQPRARWNALQTAAVERLPGSPLAMGLSQALAHTSKV